jgi:hypothetical protein
MLYYSRCNTKHFLVVQNNVQPCVENHLYEGLIVHVGDLRLVQGAYSFNWSDLLVALLFLFLDAHWFLILKQVELHPESKGHQGSIFQKHHQFSSSATRRDSADGSDPNEM